MTLSTVSTPLTRLIKPACFALCSAFLIFASRGLLSGYSYWFDEVYSVSASLDTWQQLYQRWILQSDVHPPLYHIFLKLWMLLLGSSETATRILSFIFSLVTLAAFSFDAIAKFRWRRVLALLLIGVSPLFAYYAQETRSYSLVLSLSSIVTLAALELRSSCHPASKASNNILSIIYYSGSLLLSLTHYFGWIYVFMLSVISFSERRINKARSRAIFLVAIITAWPAWHVIVGNLGGKSGGDFWIKVSPPIVGSIKIYLMGLWPFVPLKGTPSFELTWSLLVALVFVSVGSWHSIRSCLILNGREVGPLADESRFTLLSIGLVVGAMSIVDLHTPMSTPRNYIVLLPATMIFLANALAILANSRGVKSPSGASAVLLALVITLLLARLSWTGLSGKMQPMQNLKGMADYVKKSGICSKGCFFIGVDDELYKFYFSNIGVFEDLSLAKDPAGTLKNRISLDDQVDFVNKRSDAKILSFHTNAMSRIPDLLAGNQGRECIQPVQGWDNSSFLILPSSDLTGQEDALGIKKCRLPQ